MYVLKRYYDPYRGYYSIDSGVLEDMYYKQIGVSGDYINSRDILEWFEENNK